MTTGLILLAGMLTLGGAVMVVAALVPAPPGLQPALDRFGADTSPADGPRLDVAPTGEQRPTARPHPEIAIRTLLPPGRDPRPARRPRQSR